MMYNQPPRPREKRESVIIRAVATLPGGKLREHRVRNLSPSGACIEHDGRLHKGAVLELTIGAVEEIEAQVMWVEAGLAGVQFDWPIDMTEARRPRGAGRAGAGWVGGMTDAYRTMVTPRPGALRPVC